MIKLTAVGSIYKISPVIRVNDNFQKREIVIDDSWIDKEQNVRQNLICIEFTGERMAILDTLAPGQRISVETTVHGREYQGKYYNTLRGLTATPLQQAQQPQQPAQTAPQQQGYAQQPYQQAAYPPQQPAYQQPYQPAQPMYPPQGYAPTN
jgi:hypothetical protein